VSANRVNQPSSYPLLNSDLQIPDFASTEDWPLIKSRIMLTSVSCPH